MKTEQEQIEKMAGIIAETLQHKRVENGAVFVTYLPSILGSADRENEVAETLVQAGYGDISEYKAENERLTNILNSLTFSKKETDIFGKPALLMFAGVKVEEAIKRVTEYNGLKTEIERLKEETSNIRKETAREILDMLYDIGIDKEILECCRIYDVDGVSLAKQICEKYSVEIEK